MKKKSNAKDSASHSVAKLAVDDYNKSISVNTNGQIVLRVRAKPGAKKTLVTDVGEEEIGVALAAPPRDGQANQELLDAMIQFLDLRKSEIDFDKGAKSRSKVLLVSSQRFTAEQIRGKLLDCVKNC